MKKQIHRKNYSEVLSSTKLNLNRDTYYSENIPHKINEEQSKDMIFSESFSDIPKILNMNLEEISVFEPNPIFSKHNQNYNLSSRVTNKNMIKIITHKFHDLFLKLVHQIKFLKIDISNLKKHFKHFEEKSDNPSPVPELHNELFETENEVLKYLMNEELDCFNQILFDSNIQLNELQFQEESLRREILKKHKEIEKFNLEIDDCKKQKDIYIKELQNIAIKLTEYKSVIHNQGSKKSECECQMKDWNENKERYSMDNYEEDEDDTINEDYLLLLNSDNREYLVKRILQENKKYKSIVKVMKTEEAEFANYLIQLETELDNFAKFKNFCLTKMNAIDENVLKCRDIVDIFGDKINNIEFHLEMFEDNNPHKLTITK